MIHITAERIIKDLQEEFTKVFPFLKIEFFRKNHLNYQYTQKEYNLPEEQVIGGVYKAYGKEEVCITPSMTVKELEKVCEEKFGVSVHIYRKAAPNIWIETTKTDNWTMKQQNDNGSEISREINLH